MPYFLGVAQHTLVTQHRLPSTADQKHFPDYVLPAEKTINAK